MTKTGKPGNRPPKTFFKKIKMRSSVARAEELEERDLCWTSALCLYTLVFNSVGSSRGFSS